MKTSRQGRDAGRPSAVGRGGAHLDIAERRRRVPDGRPLQLRDYGDSLLEASQQPRLPCAVPLYAPLGAGFAGCQRPAELALERRDPFRRPKRSADRGGPFNSGRHRRVDRHREKPGKIGDQRVQWRDRRQLIMLAREMSAGARPWPVFGTGHQPRDHRIKSDVTRCRQQMRLVHHHCAEAALK